MERRMKKNKGEIGEGGGRGECIQLHDRPRTMFNQDYRMGCYLSDSEK